MRDCPRTEFPYSRLRDLPPAQFRELSRRSNRQGWKQAGGHFGLFFLTGAAVYLTWAQGLWIAFLVVFFAHGTVASFFPRDRNP
jgi:hypothetical protein